MQVQSNRPTHCILLCGHIEIKRPKLTEHFGVMVTPMIFKILVGNCAPKFERFQYYFTSMQHFPFHPILLSPFITCFRPFFQILLHYHDSKTQPLSLGYHHLGLYKSGQKISWNFIYLFYLEALLLKFFFIYEFFQGVKAMK